MTAHERSTYLALMKDYLDGALGDAEFAQKFLRLCDEDYAHDTRFGLGPFSYRRRRRTASGVQFEDARGRVFTACQMFDHPDPEECVSEAELRLTVERWYGELAKSV